MKRVQNTRRHSQLGLVMYEMRRRVGEQVYGYNLAVSPVEHEHHRELVAMKLWDARRRLREFILREQVEAAARALMEGKRARAREQEQDLNALPEHHQ